MKPVYVLLALTSFLVSCDGDSDEQINVLGGAVRFSLAEYMDGHDSNLTFKFLTEKDYPCINYQIDQQTEVFGDQIVVTLKEIKKADVCLDASGPATAFVDLGTMNKGEYNLIVKIGSNISSEGKLIVSDNTYEIALEEGTGDVIVDNTTLNRVPDNIIWGTIRYQEDLQKASVQNLLMNSLRGIGATEKKLTQGDYFYFNIDATGRLRSDIQGLGYEETFVMEYSGSDDQIETILQQFDQEVGQQAIIRIYNTQGEEFRTSPL